MTELKLLLNDTFGNKITDGDRVEFIYYANLEQGKKILNRKIFRLDSQDEIEDMLLWIENDSNDSIIKVNKLNI